MSTPDARTPRAATRGDLLVEACNDQPTNLTPNRQAGLVRSRAWGLPASIVRPLLIAAHCGFDAEKTAATWELCRSLDSEAQS